jgi:hypothetical protein
MGTGEHCIRPNRKGQNVIRSKIKRPKFHEAKSQKAKSSLDQEIIRPKVKRPNVEKAKKSKGHIFIRPNICTPHGTSLGL